MSVVFKNRDILPSDPYPPGINDGDQNDHDSVRYSPVPVVHDLLSYGGAEDVVMMPASPSSASLNSPNLLAPLSPPESLATPTNVDPGRPRLHSRQKAIPRPDRNPTKNRDGKYVCTFPGCTEQVKAFARKCEWEKHMDKHDRPYKCSHPSCKSQPGFTYSGGLLRHEREVHNKHGGPKNPLTCPHQNCKRHEGKGFTRPENLNEHLRRVHTPNDAHEHRSSSLAAVQEPDDEPEEVAAVLQLVPPERTGEKRKADTDLRDEVKRLQVENQELRSQAEIQQREIEAQKRQSMAMMQQISEMHARIGRLGNPSTPQPPPGA
ncbi:hypothetical protein F4677DRAFT_431292 [Hypoxylon crocopeplum]|nr:hypothetical protein F4677DRAFT_431292 [Hypoxylon crocopeplum]